MEPRDCLTLYESMFRHQTKQHALPKSLRPQKALPEIIRKSDVLQWESSLKDILLSWMMDSASPFPAVLKDWSHTSADVKKITAHSNEEDQTAVSAPTSNASFKPILPMLSALHDNDALPAIIFNFDRTVCEKMAQAVSDDLKLAEDEYKKGAAWQKKLKEWEEWKSIDEKARQQRLKSAASQAKSKGKSKGRDDEDGGSKLDRMADSAADGSHPMARFDPELPLPGYHFVDERKLSNEDFESYIKTLRWRGISEWLLTCLRRGIGVHHSGMNRKYRQIVEMLFRKGFLRVVIATGTLALGKCSSDKELVKILTDPRY